ncbi:MAG TPA: fructose-bisphosphatase class III [Spirochaetota bacterium]|nr:fructose-bisphosphatase class III [Spirochaetota bacterium]HPJ38469.1 fructose-bisphosphatase class III [Spirochaetota bacterium]
MEATRNIATLHDIIREIIEIEAELESTIDTTMWISDPHGAGERFVSILKGRFGLVWKSCMEALPRTFSPQKIDYLSRVIRKENYFFDSVYSMERQDVIAALVKIIQYRVESVSDFDEIRKNINKDLKLVLENLILNYPVPNTVYENEVIADRVISALCKVVKQVILGHLLVLGDVFDRGDEPDKILRILNKNDIKPYVTFVWGNHDILWMGAAAGNRSLIAEALRISVRYDNMKFLSRIGIDISRLEQYAESLYPENPSGFFKAKQDRSKKMEKTLAMIQFKLEEATIKENPEFEMEPRLNLEILADKLKRGDTGGLSDKDFPTLDLDNPTKLTEGEREIIDDLARQFTSSKRIKELMQFLFEHGSMYHINNYILNVHALIPSTADGEFEDFLGKKGKKLFNHIDDTVKNVGRKYLNGEPQDPKELALMFYLWCGPKSPFFGKDAMKTFERYFYTDKATHKEKLLYWGENIKKPEFMDMIMTEFDTRRIVYGHTPVDVTKGDRIASPDGRAINIDGGFSHAYLERGHSLIHTPYSLYAIILPTPEEIKEARMRNEALPLMTENIDTFDRPVKIKDTWQGKALVERRDKLFDMLREYSSNAANSRGN